MQRQKSLVAAINSKYRTQGERRGDTIYDFGVIHLEHGFSQVQPIYRMQISWNCVGIKIKVLGYSIDKPIEPTATKRCGTVRVGPSILMEKWLSRILDTNGGMLVLPKTVHLLLGFWTNE